MYHWTDSAYYFIYQRKEKTKNKDILKKVLLIQIHILSVPKANIWIFASCKRRAVDSVRLGLEEDPLEITKPILFSVGSSENKKLIKIP